VAGWTRAPARGLRHDQYPAGEGSVRQQITEATDTHYIYIPVADKEEMKVVEDLAFKQGKSTQRIKNDGKTTACVFILRYW
jgi:hypothetical protein